PRMTCWTAATAATRSWAGPATTRCWAATATTASTAAPARTSTTAAAATTAFRPAMGQSTTSSPTRRTCSWEQTSSTWGSAITDLERLQAGAAVGFGERHLFRAGALQIRLAAVKNPVLAPSFVLLFTKAGGSNHHTGRLLGSRFGKPGQSQTGRDQGPPDAVR